MMKKTLLVIPFLGYTGAERVIFTLLNNLDRNKVIPHVLIYSDDEEMNPLLKKLNPDVQVTAINFKGRFRYNVHNIIIGIHRACIKFDIDTVIISDGSTNASISPFLKLIGKKDTKFIARESNLPTLHEKNKIVLFLYKFFYKNYDLIIAQSDDMMEELSVNLGLPISKMVKINNPLDYKLIRESMELLPEVFLPKGRINLLTIGRLTYQKGFDLLLNSFSSLEDKHKYHLTIIGSGEECTSLKKLCSELNLDRFVTFLPKVDNPYAVMKQADIYISSSRWEGYPNVVIESIACGLPVLSNRYPGGINEIINPENGIICDIKNELQSSLIKMLSLKNVRLENEYNTRIFEKYVGIL